MNPDKPTPIDELVKVVRDEICALDLLTSCVKGCWNSRLTARGSKNATQISTDILEACINDCNAAMPLLDLLKEHAQDLVPENDEKESKQAVYDQVRENLCDISDKVEDAEKVLFAEDMIHGFYEGDRFIVNRAYNLVQKLVEKCSEVKRIFSKIEQIGPIQRKSTSKESKKNTKEASILDYHAEKLISPRTDQEKRWKQEMQHAKQERKMLRSDNLLQRMRVTSDAPQEPIKKWNISKNAPKSMFHTNLFGRMKNAKERPMYIIKITLENANTCLAALGYSLEGVTKDSIFRFYLEKYLEINADTAANPIGNKPTQYYMDVSSTLAGHSREDNGMYYALQCNDSDDILCRTCLLRQRIDLTEESMLLEFILLESAKEIPVTEKEVAAMPRDVHQNQHREQNAQQQYQHHRADARWNVQQHNYHYYEPRHAHQNQQHRDYNKQNVQPYYYHHNEPRHAHHPNQHVYAYWHNQDVHKNSRQVLVADFCAMCGKMKKILQ